MDHTEILADISNCCRLCLTDNSILRNIFSNDEKNWVEDDISKQIFECTTIQVTIYDGPTGICRQCFKELCAILAFRSRCIKSNKYLHTRYNGIYFNSLSCLIDSKPTTDITYPTFIDLGDENSLMQVESNTAATTSTSNIDDIKLEDLSDYDMPSPDFNDICNSTNEQDDESDESDTVQAVQDSPETHADDKLLKTKQQLLKCRYKLKGSKQPERYIEKWPKLKKRDLLETKAYRGLCHLCGKEFQHLWVHLQSHSEVPTETCDICGKGFRSKANLALHILMHKEADMPCSVCGKKYRTKMRLKRHMRIHTGNRPFACTVCQKRFYTKYNVDVHMRTHTGDKPYSCDFCLERFTHSYALKHHVDKMHKTF